MELTNALADGSAKRISQQELHLDNNKPCLGRRRQWAGVEGRVPHSEMWLDNSDKTVLWVMTMFVNQTSKAICGAFTSAQFILNNCKNRFLATEA